MKKNILLVLLSAALLTGCEFDITLQRFFGGLKSGQETQQNNEENTENSQEKPAENAETDNQQLPNGDDNNNQQLSDGDDNQQQGTDSGNTSATNKKEHTVTVLTSGSSFASTFTDRTQFGNTAGTTDLKNFISGQIQNVNLLTSLTCETLQAFNYKESRILQFGSGSGPGSLMWESENYKIYKVEVTVCCYTKYNDSDQIWNTDNFSHFLIDDTDKDLTFIGDEEPQMSTFSKTYEEGVNQFQLSSLYGRVFLKEMSITWRSE